MLYVCKRAVATAHARSKEARMKKPVSIHIANINLVYAGQRLYIP
jgi:hypothetical protein